MYGSTTHLGPLLLPGDVVTAKRAGALHGRDARKAAQSIFGIHAPRGVAPHVCAAVGAAGTQLANKRAYSGAAVFGKVLQRCPKRILSPGGLWGVEHVGHADKPSTSVGRTYVRTTLGQVSNDNT